MKFNKDTSNLIFSAFLVTAFIICSYFFSILIQDSSTLNDTGKLFFTALVYAVFGLVLFYATRVGDGKQVRRFSLSTLLIMVIPAFYIIMAGISPNLPFSEQIHAHSEIVSIAAVAFGYGIPYTFLSGYELDRSRSGKPQPQKTAPAETEKDAFDELAEMVSDHTDSVENNDLSDKGE